MLLKMFFKYFVLFGLENNKNFKRLHSENALCTTLEIGKTQQKVSFVVNIF